jgi:hypothetical protein
MEKTVEEGGDESMLEERGEGMRGGFVEKGYGEDYGREWDESMVEKRGEGLRGVVCRGGVWRRLLRREGMKVCLRSGVRMTIWEGGAMKLLLRSRASAPYGGTRLRSQFLVDFFPFRYRLNFKQPYTPPNIRWWEGVTLPPLLYIRYLSTSEGRLSCVIFLPKVVVLFERSVK